MINPESSEAFHVKTALYLGMAIGSVLTLLAMVVTCAYVGSIG